MSRRSTYVTLSLTAAVAFFVGTIFAGGFRGPADVAGPGPDAPARPAARRPASRPGASIDFADIVEHINAAVVSIDASSKARAGKRKHNRHDEDDDLDDFDAPFDLGRGRRDTESTRSTAGFSRHSSSTPSPTIPVAPVMMTFMGARIA